MLTAALVLALLGAAGPSWSEDPAPEEDPGLARVAALEAAIAEHRAEKDDHALVEDAKAALALWREGEDRPWRPRALEALAGILKASKAPQVEAAALDALGETGAKEVARHLKPYLRVPAKDEADPVLQSAIGAAGKIGEESLALPLLALVEKAKHAPTAGAALKALGAFREAKKVRQKILEDVAGHVEKNRPGVRPGRYNPQTGFYAPSARGSATRYEALAPLLPDAMNRLTGQRIGTTQEWLDIVKAYRGRTADLFRDEE
jgi:hypothetical protein